MRIDHVLWATPDLDAAAEHLAREYGLQAVGGGRHVGTGHAQPRSSRWAAATSS